MASAMKHKPDGTPGTESELPEIFSRSVNPHLLYEAVKCHLANQRQGTAKTKSRTEVSGGGEKPFRQKGTGRARAGSNTSPIWVRGGKAHGARPRSYQTSLNRKARRHALAMALSDKASQKGVSVIEEISLSAPKTKEVASILKEMGIQKESVLLVIEDEKGTDVRRAGRNISRLRIMPIRELNAYEVLRCGRLVLTQKSVEHLAEAFSK